MRHSYHPRTLRRLLTAACVALLACLVGTGLVLLAADPDLTARRIWRGYYTVLLEPAGDLGAVARDLAARPGIDAVVSRHTSGVSFTTFGGFRSARIVELPWRLDPQDPRRDPYLSSVDTLFALSGGEVAWEVFYVDSRLPHHAMLQILSTALRGHRWAVADVDLVNAGLRILLCLLFAGVLLLRCDSWPLAAVLAAGVLPWLAAVAVGTFTVLLVFLLAMPLWAELLRRFQSYLDQRDLSQRPSDPGRLQGPGRLSAVALGLVAVALLLHGPGALLAVLLPPVSGLLLLALQYGLSAWQSAGRIHSLFRPTPILHGLAPRRPYWNRRRTLDVALVLIVFASLAAARGEAWRPDLPYYLPVRLGGPGDSISWKVLERLAAEGDRTRPPTLADYLSHRAYQEALPFGRPYRFPTAGERVTISRYLRVWDGPGILRTERVVKRFQETWVRETLAAAPIGSVERLLVDQGYSARVEVHEAQSGRRVRPAAETYLATLAVGLFLAFWLLGGDFRLTAPRLCVTTLLTLRRHQHPS